MKRLSLAERVRGRLNQLIHDREISLEALAPHLEISASGVSKLLSGKNAISLDHVDGFCVALQVSPAELTTEVGALIQPLSPLEAAILDVLRKMDRHRQHSLLDVLEWQRSSTIPVKGPWGRKDRLTTEDEMVLSLYRGLVDADAQAGIVMQMRGYVRARLEADTDAEREEK